MNAERLIAAGVSSLLLAGCTTGPVFENYAGGDAACIEVVPRERSNHDSLSMLVEGVDGQKTSPPKWRTPEQRCVSPGEHRLALWGWRRGTKWGDNGWAYLDWRFEPGRRYELRATANRRNTVHFSLADITAGQKARLLEFDGDDWPEPLYSAPVYTQLSAKGPGAAVMWDRTQILALDFASDFGLPREDGVCPYGFYGIARGDLCITYLYNPSSSEGTSLVISYSTKLRRSILIFTRSVPLLGAKRSAVEVKEQFEKAVVSPLRNELGSEIHCEIGCL